jgi:predicted nucleic acid-binding protein
MPNDKIVLNSSPLIVLFKGGFEQLLSQLFSEVVVPEAVWDEISRGTDIAAQRLSQHSDDWLTRMSVSISDEILVWNLGAGESEALSYAWQHRTEFAVAVDDKAARSCAQALGIKTLGTGGIMLLAKRRGLLASVGDALNALQAAGLYLSDEIISILLPAADE